MVKQKVLNFSQLVKRLKEADNFPALIRTAYRTGWLTDGTFYTKLTDKEFEKVKEIYEENTDAKNVDSLDIEKVLPTVCGLEVDKVKLNAKIAKLTAAACDTTVNVDAGLFQALKKRHPKATYFLSPQSESIVFSEDKHISAALLVVN